MTEFRRANTTRLNGFPVDGRVLFKQYFEDRDVFGELSSYYNGEAYRFEVPMADLPEVRELLEEAGFGLVVVSEPAEFGVAKRKYTHHPDVLFKSSVLSRNRGDYHCYLMKDRSAVEQALINGAVRLDSVAVTLDL